MKTGFSRHTPHIDVFMGGIAMKAYLERCEDVLKAQNTSNDGLSTAEAEKRIAEYGYNKHVRLVSQSVFIFSKRKHPCQTAGVLQFFFRERIT